MEKYHAWGENPTLNLKPKKPKQIPNIDKNILKKAATVAMIVFIAIILIQLIVNIKSKIELEAKKDSWITESEFSTTKQFCEKLDYAPLKDKCLLNLAVKDNNKRLCREIEQKESKDSCLKLLKGEQSACDTIPETIKNDCYYNLAYVFEDPAYCELGNSKYSLQSFNPTTITPESILDCKIVVALRTQDIGVCNSLASTSQRRCIQQLALILNDISYCDKIEKEASKTACYKLVNMRSASNSGEESECNKINETFFKDICLLELASNTENYEICHQSSKPEDCILSLVPSLLDKSMCISKNLGADFEQQCIFTLATHTMDIELCNTLDSSSVGNDPETCIFQIAIQFSDLETCQSLSTRKDECLYELAVSKKNVEMCDGIAEAQIKRRCNDAITKGMAMLLPDLCSIGGFECMEWNFKDDKIHITLNTTRDETVTDLTFSLQSTCSPVKVTITPENPQTFSCQFKGSKGESTKQDIYMTYTDSLGRLMQTIGYIKYTLVDDS